MDQREVEKLKAGVEMLAPVIARYVASLTEAGLTRAEALEMAKAWQDSALRSGAQAAQQSGGGK